LERGESVDVDGAQHLDRGARLRILLLRRRAAAAEEIELRAPVSRPRAHRCVRAAGKRRAALELSQDRARAREDDLRQSREPRDAAPCDSLCKKTMSPSCSRAETLQFSHAECVASSSVSSW